MEIERGLGMWRIKAIGERTANVGVSGHGKGEMPNAVGRGTAGQADTKSQRECSKRSGTGRAAGQMQSGSAQTTAARHMLTRQHAAVWTAGRAEYVPG